MNEEKQDYIGDPRDFALLVGPLLELLPGVGSVLSSAWSDYSSNRRLKHIEDVIAKIRSQIAPGFVLNDFADTPAAMHLLAHVLQLAELEHAEKKRERFANVIVSSWLAAEPIDGIFDESVLFAEATAKFNDSHIAVLM